MTNLIQDDEHRADMFGWDPVRKTLRQAIDWLPPPGCIALYGPWGAGKTTTLRHLQKAIDAEELHVSVWFDPWEYERSANLPQLLMQSILRQLAKKGNVKNDWKEKAAGLFRKFTKLTLNTAAGLARIGGVPIPDDIPDQIGDLTIEAIFGGGEQLLDEVQEIKKEFAEIVRDALGTVPQIGGKECKLIVFLDDLDRCLPESALSVIEATKILLCGRPVDGDKNKLPALFVFALDRQLVGEAVANHYGSRNRYTGESYLEKIFDVSIEVPPASPAGLTNLLGEFEAFKKLVPPKNKDDQEKDQRKMVLDALSKPVFCNPRVLMRTVNRLILMARGMEAVQGWPTDDQDWKRLIWWLAGAERFRSFRLAFSSATRAEIDELHQVLGPNKGGAATAVSPAVVELAATPRLSEFYDLMFESFTSKEVDMEREQKGARDPRMTIRAFEDLLRPLGV